MVALIALVVAVACTDEGDDGDATSDEVGTATPSSEAAGAATTTELPACGEDTRQLVLFHLNGALTSENEVAILLGDPTYDMLPRSGASGVAQAYYQRGYELVYTTRGTDDLLVGDQPFSAALVDWLERHGLPYDERATLWLGMADLPLRQELLTQVSRGASIYAGYSNVAQDVTALAVAGVPPERIYTFTELPDVGETNVLPDGDLTAHLADLESLPPVCRTE